MEESSVSKTTERPVQDSSSCHSWTSGFAMSASHESSDSTKITAEESLVRKTTESTVQGSSSGHSHSSESARSASHESSCSTNTALASTTGSVNQATRQLLSIAGRKRVYPGDPLRSRVEGRHPITNDPLWPWNILPIGAYEHLMSEDTAAEGVRKLKWEQKYVFFIYEY